MSQKMSEKEFQDKLDTIKKTNKPLKEPKVKQTKQEENKVKTFISKPIVIVILTIALTLSAVYASYTGYKAIYNQGYNDAKTEQAKIDAIVAESKQVQ